MTTTDELIARLGNLEASQATGVADTRTLGMSARISRDEDPEPRTP